MSDSKVYEIVTEKILAQLEAGTVPWRKPWTSAQLQPRNLVSGKAYRGVNRFMLACTGHASPFWLSYKQALQLGGHVRKGEKSTLIVFWKIDVVQGEPDPEVPEDSGKRKRVILRYYSGFNSEQCELPEKVMAKIAAATKVAEAVHTDPIAECESIVAGMPKAPVINRNGSRACYQPREDQVTVPPRETFTVAPAEFYSTLYHELGHSTGHKSRLGRKGVMEAIIFGSGDYSREELVAEMTAAFLCAESGILPTTLENSAAYIASWVKVLKGDSKAVVIAAAQAQKAADYVLDRKPEATTASEDESAPAGAAA